MRCCIAPAALLCTLLLFLASSPVAAFFNPLLPMRGRARAPNAAWQVLRKACRATPACAVLADDEADDCILRCTSPECWALVYEGDILEPGQVDSARAKEFDSCLKKSEAGLQSAGLWPPLPAVAPAAAPSAPLDGSSGAEAEL